jgi:hypothetical protein
VLVGAYQTLNTSDGEAQFRRILGDFVPHPEYTGDVNEGHDLALFRIRPVTRSNLKTPIEMNLNLRDPVANETLTLIGFGKTEQGAQSAELRTTTTKAISRIMCENVLGHPRGLYAGLGIGCVLSDDIPSSGFCSGDSGGPVFISGTNGSPPVLVGVVSFSFPSE